MKYKYPKHIDGNGDRNESCFHGMEFCERLRFQVNANDTLYIRDKKTARKIGKWFLKMADALPNKKDRKCT